MAQAHTDRKTLLLVFTFLFLITFLTPASASFFPFLSKKTILPNEYSKHEDQINAYNEQAVELFEKGHFKEAQELWEKAIQLIEHTSVSSVKSEKTRDIDVPADEGILISAAETIKGHSDEENLYQEAIVLFKKQKYVASKKIFDRLESRVPDYKATRNYITILNHKIKQVQQTLSSDRFKEGALYRQKERGDWKRILEESERELEKKLVEQVAPLYKEALQFYKSREFTLAKDYFTEIDGILPKYKDTTKYLLRINADIRAEEQRFVKEKYKKQVLARKKEQEEWQRIMAESEQHLQEKIKKQAEPIYQEGLHYYKLRQFELAKGRFQEVDQISPGYKSAAKYLSRIDDEVRKETELRELNRVREFERKTKEEKLAREHEEKRLEKLQAVEEKNRRRQFEQEIALRKKERDEWLKVLAESEAERQRKIREQADFVYREAIQFYKRRDFKQARKDFREVEEILPNYKSTAKYLARIDQDIAEEEQQRLAQQQRMYTRKLQEDKLVEYQQFEEERRLRAIEDQKRLREFKAKATARQKQRDEWDRILKKNERDRQKKLKQEAEFIYKEALRAYKRKDWERARSRFLEVGQILAGYRKSEKYLARIDDDIKEEQHRIKIAEAKSIERQRRKEALVREREQNRQEKIREKDKKRQMKQQEDQADAVYKFAESLYKRGDYMQAKDKFLEVEQILPGYKSAARYLKRIDADVAQAQDRYRQEQQFVFQRKIQEEQLAQKYEEEKAEALMRIEKKARLKDLRKESLARQKTRKEWKKVLKQTEVQNKKRLKQQAESIYQEALRYYNAGWFEQAKETFEEVEVVMPGYKSSERYLAKIDQNIRSEDQIQQASEKKIQEYLDREERVFTKNQKKVVSSVPEPNGNAVVKMAVADRRKERSKEAEIQYREALSSYKHKNFIEAKLKFIEVESFSPGYKATLDYLKRIDEKIMDQKKQFAQAQANDQPVEAVDPQNIDSRHDLIQQTLMHTEGTFKKKKQQRMSVSESSAKHKLKHSKTKGTDDDRDQLIKDRRKKLKAHRRAVHKEHEKQFQKLYDKAVKLYRSGAYVEAKKLFLQIERMKPGYKKAASYIKKAKRKISKGLQQESSTIVVQSPKNKKRVDIISEALDVFEKSL